jgi:hypothetical protein
MNLIYTFPCYFFRIPFILSSHLLSVAIGLFPLGFPTKTLYTCVFFPTYVTCPTHLTFLDMITQMNTSTDNINCSSHIMQYLTHISRASKQKHTIIKYISEVMSNRRKNDKNCTMYCNTKFIYPHVMWQLYTIHFIKCFYSAYYFLGDSAPSVISWFNHSSY